MATGDKTYTMTCKAVNRTGKDDTAVRFAGKNGNSLTLQGSGISCSDFDPESTYKVTIAKQ
jgi:hypothetical protein